MGEPKVYCDSLRQDVVTHGNGLAGISSGGWDRLLWNMEMSASGGLQKQAMQMFVRNNTRMRE